MADHADDKGAPAWAPYLLNGTASDYDEGLWLDSGDDVVSSDNGFFRSSPSGAKHALDFPRNWPAIFNESATLKRLVNKQLRGTRCRVVGPSAASEASTAAALVKLRPLHSLQNAQNLHDLLGWDIIKGFIVFERSLVPTPEAAEEATAGIAEAAEARASAVDSGAGREQFLAIRHWWNASADGAWLDLTPSFVPSLPGREMRSLLVQSEKGGKRAGVLTPSRRAFAVGLAHQLIREGSLGLMAYVLNHRDALAAALTNEKAGEGRGAAQLDGRMIDAASERMAENIVNINNLIQSKK